MYWHFHLTKKKKKKSTILVLCSNVNFNFTQTYSFDSFLYNTLLWFLPRCYPWVAELSAVYSILCRINWQIMKFNGGFLVSIWVISDGLIKFKIKIAWFCFCFVANFSTGYFPMLSSEKKKEIKSMMNPIFYDIFKYLGDFLGHFVCNA